MPAKLFSERLFISTVEGLPDLKNYVLLIKLQIFRVNLTSYLINYKLLKAINDINNWRNNSRIPVLS